MNLEQWIEVRQLFSSNEAQVVIIHCKSGGINEEWETETICWPEILNGEVVYRSVNIATYIHSLHESGYTTYQRRYWPIDLNADGLQDLLVLEWLVGEGILQQVDEKGKDTSEHMTCNVPRSLRLIQRKNQRGWPWGIESDKVVKWADVVQAPQIYRRHLEAARSTCQDNVWKQRLTKAIDELDVEK